MHSKRRLLASSVLSALAFMSTATHAQSTDKSLAPIVVTATPFSAGEGAQILALAKVLSGNGRCAAARTKLDCGYTNQVLRLSEEGGFGIRIRPSLSVVKIQRQAAGSPWEIFPYWSILNFLQEKP
jgi:hypothetical protein